RDKLVTGVQTCALPIYDSTDRNQRRPSENSGRVTWRPASTQQADHREAYNRRMGLIFNAVAGELPLVQRVWSASCDAATGFTSAAKASSMIAFARSGDGLTVHLRGPETTGTSLVCPVCRVADRIEVSASSGNG